jgi:lipid A 3-O-deacylase
MNITHLFRPKSGAVWMNAFLLIAAFLFVGPAYAEEDEGEDVETRFGLSLSYGNSYTPTGDIGFLLLSGMALFDYDRIWPHRAPSALRFKVEGAAGATVASEYRGKFMASMSIFALYYLDALSGKALRSYIEGGIGVIYTDFQVEGQGLRFNFNPQFGFGAEFPRESKKPYFAALRLHHISNAGLDDENKGINSIVFTLGRFF